jgi:LacI family transcriptional regulator, galactose operon repressor
MQEASGRQLAARTVYELFNEHNLVSVSTEDRSSALASGRRGVQGERRLIGVAMNLAPWLLKLESDQTRTHNFFDDVLLGIRIRADVSNIDLLLLTGASSRVSGKPTHYADICREHGAEGIILASFLPEEPELAELVASGFPTVAIDTKLIGPHASFVSSDNVGGAATAVRHLAELGRKRIAYISAWDSEPANIDRHLGYKSALDEFGLELREEYVVLGGWSHVHAHDATQQMLELAEPPDAVFCASDLMAIGAIKAVQEAGLRVPEDIAVASFDDSDYATFSVPSITSVHQDRIGLGTASVETILRMLDAPDSSPPSTVFPTELVVRESTVSKVDLELPTKLETRTEPIVKAPTSRLSVDALYQLLSASSEFESKAPREAPVEAVTQDWDPKTRRLIAIAIYTATEISFRHNFFDELFDNIRAVAYAKGIDLLFFSNVGNAIQTTGTTLWEKSPPLLEVCQRSRADGLILGSLLPEVPQVAAVIESDLPCAMFDGFGTPDSKRVALVMSDNTGGGTEVTRHLVESGHRRIAYIGGVNGSRASDERFRGYQNELSRQNLPHPDEYVAQAGWLPSRAYETTQRFLALPEPPDAIFCAEDMMAIAAIAAIEDAGLRVPDDVAVAGFDDIDYATLVTPLLTTVRQNQKELANALVEAVLHLLDDPERSSTEAVIPAELVVRESSGFEQATRDGSQSETRVGNYESLRS